MNFRFNIVFVSSREVVQQAASLGENKLVDVGKLFLAQLSGVVQFL